VGNDVQGEPWLDEGLTSYSQVLYYESLGNAEGAAGEIQHFRSQYGIVRNTASDGPIGGSVGSFHGNYVSLVYAKGALFFHALRQQIGEEAFAQFLRDYYATYRYDEATGPAMLTQAEQACACDLQPFYDDWVVTGAPVDIP
jgi:aminopeptidase N